MSDWRIKQRVVCIDDQYCDGSGRIEELRLNAVYTIRAIRRRSEMVLFLFEEFKQFNPIAGCEVWNAAWRFRPLVETKTDISVFERMCDPTRRVKENA